MCFFLSFLFLLSSALVSLIGCHLFSFFPFVVVCFRRHGFPCHQGFSSRLARARLVLALVTK